MGVLIAIVVFAAVVCAAVGGIPAFLDLPSGYDVDQIQEEAPLLDNVSFYGARAQGDAFFFCLDRSRSMMAPGSDGRQLLERAKAETLKTIAELSAESVASVLLCYRRGPTILGNPAIRMGSAGKALLRGFVSATENRSGSDIGTGIVVALRMANRGCNEHCQLLVVSDGETRPAGGCAVRCVRVLLILLLALFGVKAHGATSEDFGLWVEADAGPLDPPYPNCGMPSEDDPMSLGCAFSSGCW